MAKPSLRFEKRKARYIGELGFFPDEPWALERFHMDYLDGKKVGLVISDPARNGMLGLWWAGIKLLYDNQDEFATERKLHEEILKKIGLSKKLYRIDKTFVREVVDSIAIENMTDEEFKVVQEKAREYVVGRWGYDPWDLWVEQQEARRR